MWNEKEYKHNYYQRNKERLKAASRADYEAHKEDYIKRAEEWRKTNPSKRREICKRYYDNHIEEIKSNRYDSFKKWASTHPEERKANGKANLYRRRARGSYINASVVKQVVKEEPYCRTCGLDAVDIDHIIPVADDGGNERANLQRLCKPCHKIKTAKEIKERAIRRRDEK